jgi:hypothetical protein
MVSVELAKQLRAAGLSWRPSQFDHFHIPDRGLDGRQFVIADLTVDVQYLADGIAAITFNGAVEWSLDYILQQDVVWLPTESQIRERVGDRLAALERHESGFTCLTGDGNRFTADTAADAYGLAVLHLLRNSAPV